MISSAPKSSSGAAMLIVPLLTVPVTKRELFELNKKSDVNVIFPPIPVALALIRLLRRTMKRGSMVMFPPVPPPFVPAVAVIELSTR